MHFIYIYAIWDSAWSLREWDMFNNIQTQHAVHVCAILVDYIRTYVACNKINPFFATHISSELKSWLLDVRMCIIIIYMYNFYIIWASFRAYTHVWYSCHGYKHIRNMVGTTCHSTID